MDLSLVLALVLGLAVILYILARSCEYVESAANSLAFRVGMPASVAGATLLAVASSAPEFFTSTSAAVFYGLFEVGLLTIIWSAIFNILVIPGVAAVTSKEPLRVSKAVVHRDGIGYLAAMFIVLLVIEDGVISRADAGIMLILYVLYLHVIYLMSKAHSNDPEEHLDEPEKVQSPQRIAVYMVVGLLVIGAGTHFMIEIGDIIATEVGMSILVFSAFIFAPGTSIPDLFVSLYAARRGEGATAVSNVFGSNIFDLTICLAVPVMIVGDVTLALGHVWPSIIILVALQFVVVFLVRTEWQVERWEGVVMLIAFAAALIAFLVTLPDEEGKSEVGPPAESAAVTLEVDNQALEYAEPPRTHLR